MDRSFRKLSITLIRLPSTIYATILFWLIFFLHLLSSTITLYIEINITNSYEYIYIYIGENNNIIFIDGNNSYFSNRVNEKRREADEKSFNSFRIENEPFV